MLPICGPRVSHEHLRRLTTRLVPGAIRFTSNQRRQVLYFMERHGGGHGPVNLGSIYF